MRHVTVETKCLFQSTLPVWGATSHKKASNTSAFISIHAPRVGSDGNGKRLAGESSYFNPRSPCGERHLGLKFALYSPKFQSTLPVWGATPGQFLVDCTRCHFNPRSPCGERRSSSRPRRFPATISIHAPRVGSDQAKEQMIGGYFEFQSTLPVWGATTATGFCVGCILDFNPRSPCGERPTKKTSPPSESGFQSTLPVWGATSGIVTSGPFCGISIHAPRVGSDRVRRRAKCKIFDFNPRSPCGERRCD